MNSNLPEIKLFDSYKRKIVDLNGNSTLKKDIIKIYSCGPTVYNYMHIGNLRATWLPDTITKIAKIAGYQTEWVQNITDVGHLVSDGDDGEDKMEKGVKRENKTVAEIVEFYTDDFKKQCEVLNFNLPKGKFQPRPTEYIKEQMLLALELVRDKKAYILDNGIYFDSGANKALEVEVQNDESSVTKLVELIKNKNKENSKPFIIAIDGRSGSGKSTLTSKLEKQIPNSKRFNLDAYTIRSGDFFSKELVESRYEIDFENTEYNIEKIQQHIKTSNSSVIFLEGSFCFKNLGDIETDFKILVEVNAKIAADRLNNREIRERTEIDSEIIKLSTIKWQEAEERYINVFKPKEHADIVVSTEDEGYKIIENTEPTNYTGRDIKNTTKNPEDFALWKFVEENALQKWRFNQFDETAEILKEISNGLQDSPSVKGWTGDSQDGVVSRSADNYYSLPFNQNLKEKARILRSAGNLSEVILWNQIKNKKLLGLDFDRQKIIGDYIVDFYSPNIGLVIEIDGQSHDNKGRYDADREKYLSNLGLTIIHFEDIQIKKKLAEVLNSLYSYVEKKLPRQPLAATPSAKGNLRTQGSIGLNNIDDNNRIHSLPNRWGCPGWHSECVAMICAILGDKQPKKSEPFSFNNYVNQTVIDIHTGGEDHIDIHHKNEILQSKALGFNLSKYWVHNKFVMVDNKKMAKSDGNVFMATGNYEQTGFYSLTNPPVEIVNNLEKKYQITGFDPLAFRLMFLEHHYCEQLNFTWEKMEQSQNRLWNLRKEMAKIQSFAKLNNISETLETKQIQVLLGPLLDNLDIPKFLEKFQAFLLDTTTEIQKNNNLNPKNLAALNYWESQFLQLNLNPNIPTEILELGQQRLTAKADKDYPKSDQIRNEILASGYQIDDYSWGYGFWFRG